MSTTTLTIIGEIVYLVVLATMDQETRKPIKSILMEIKSKIGLA
ncbi:MAG: hypothetical protein OEY88_05895 [Candidatus Bathyarchaeota archaeon]|nr:hypothetical protein [Candidatus Bathyarchaeota archaeon]